MKVDTQVEPESSVDLFLRLLGQSPAGNPLPAGSNRSSSLVPVPVSSPVHASEAFSQTHIEGANESSRFGLPVEIKPEEVKAPFSSPVSREWRDEDLKSESPLSSVPSSPSIGDYDSLKDEAESVLDLKDEVESVAEPEIEEREDGERAPLVIRPRPMRRVYVELDRLSTILARDRTRKRERESVSRTSSRAKSTARPSTKPHFPEAMALDDEDLSFGVRDQSVGYEPPPIVTASPSPSSARKRFGRSSSSAPAPDGATPRRRSSDPQFTPIPRESVIKMEYREPTLDFDTVGRFVSADDYKPIKLEENIPENKPDWRKLKMEIPVTLKRRTIDSVKWFEVLANSQLQSKTVKRFYISTTFGGSSVKVFPKIKAERRREHSHWHWLFAPDWLHPFSPLRPGEPGIWFDTGPAEGIDNIHEEEVDPEDSVISEGVKKELERLEEKEHEQKGKIKPKKGDDGVDKRAKKPRKKKRKMSQDNDDDDEFELNWDETTVFHAFRGLKQSLGNWLYVGEYTLREIRPPLTTEEYKSLEEELKNAWADKLKTGGWGRFIALRAITRKEHGRFPTQAEYDLVDSLSNFQWEAYVENRVSIEDMKVGFEEGTEVMTIDLMCPVGYDVDFQERISRESPIYEAAAKLARQERKRVKEAKAARVSEETEATPSTTEAGSRKRLRSSNDSGRATKAKKQRHIYGESSSDEDGEESDPEKVVIETIRRGTARRPRK